MAKHLILLDFNANPLFDDDLAEEVSTFGELKLYLNRLSTDDKKSLSWWENLEVLDSAHNKYEKGDDTLIFDEYDGIENCLVLYTKPKAKKQESGANTERSRILNRIKELNLGKVVKEKYGKNQTQVASPLLLALIAEVENGVVTADNSKTMVETVEIVETTPTEPQSESKPALTTETPVEEAPKEEEQEYDEIRILIPRALQSKVKIVTSPNPKRDWTKLKDLNPFK
jgi:hypothetical protein